LEQVDFYVDVINVARWVLTDPIQITGTVTNFNKLVLIMDPLIKNIHKGIEYKTPGTT